MLYIIPLLCIIFLIFEPVHCQKRIREKGESDYPFLVNMWIPRNREINQYRPRFCDAVQLTPFTDYFFTSAKCFDNLQHAMWLEDIGISWDERVVTYSRHMSFLTRYKEEGGHFVILERFETNPNAGTIQFKDKNSDETKPETEDTTESSGKSSKETPDSENSSEGKFTTKSTDITTAKPTPKREDDEYEDLPPDLAQYNDLEDQYEIKEQTKEDPNMRMLREFRNKRVRLSTPDVRGATQCYVLGWSTYLRQYDDIRDIEGFVLKREIVKKLPRRACKSTDPSHICVAKVREDGRECVEDLGSPLVCERRDNNNNTIGIALVGIYTGFKNCVTTDIGIFRSLSSELPWIARWARGTPITTSGFVTNHRYDLYPVRRRRRSRRRSGGVKIYVEFCILLVIFLSLAVKL